ncbi:uncharacterized protein LOC131521686 [Onychostoma macrolepis]|uniref:uncharacterized protein LOC131521686 n=1 Tax=Onychostoma macrolepis TaxID=369639 RepID=UPI00272AB560|nr:uncharacterized protein LOC131521686 [Onychostoma macrolepis]
MPRKRFQLLRRYVHFDDNQQCSENPDRFDKIRPHFEMLRKQCLLIPSTYKHSVDEVMIRYKGTRAGTLCQYIGNKPDKWGFKAFCRASSSGIIHDLLLYQGASTFFNVALIKIILFMYTSIKLTLGASVVLRCPGKRQNDGQFLFVILYDIKEYFSDCEKQWLVNGTLTGLFAEGYPSFISPITNLTASTATLQACPENLECLLSCPTGRINEKQQCSCDVSATTSLSEVGFSDWSIGVWTGVTVSVTLLIFVIIAFGLYKKKQRSRFSPNGPVPTEEI